MKKFHKFQKILAALMVFTMLFGSVPAWATGIDLEIQTNGDVYDKAAPGAHQPDYSDKDYAGVSGSTTSRNIGNNVSSITTVEGGVAQDVYGIYACGSNGVTADSITGGIALNSTAKAYGINAEGKGKTTVSGLGGITATGSTAAYGISSCGSTGFENNVSFAEGGTINATSGSGNAYGIEAKDHGTTTVTGLGGITANGSRGVNGINSDGKDAGFENNVSFAEGGTINATSTGNQASGINAEGTGTTTVSGLGGITANGSANAYGIYGKGTDTGFSNNVTFSGTGSYISATSGSGAAYGIYAYKNGTTTVKNLGSITANASGTKGCSSYGIYSNGSVAGFSNNVSFCGSGSYINATSGSGNAYGIGAYTNGTTTVTNLGGITATANGNGDATGIYSSSATTNVTFSGDGSYINATSRSTGEDHAAYGIYACGSGKTTVSGLGSITATAYGNGSLTYAVGIFSYGSTGFENNVSFVAKGGTINATIACGEAIGINAEGEGTTTVTNLGSITANGSSAAYGIYSLGPATTNVSFKGNGGQAITATAANAANAYSIYRGGQGATTVNFEDSILSGKIYQDNTSTLTLNFNNGGVWTPADGEVEGTVAVNLNEGGEIDTRTRGTDGNVTTAVVKTVNIPGTTICASNGSKVSFDAKAEGDNSTGTLTTDTITVNAASSGKIDLGSVNVLDNATDYWTTAKTSASSLFSASGIQLNGTTTTTTSNKRMYTFTGNSDGTVSAKSEKAVTYTLPQIIQANPQEAGTSDTYSMTADETMTESLGTLNNDYRSSGKKEFTLNGNSKTLTAASVTNSGVTINAGDTMTVKDVTTKGFDTFATNAGTLNLDGVTFSGTTGSDVINNGTLNLTGTNTFVKGIVNSGNLNSEVAGLTANVTNSGTVAFTDGGTLASTITGGKVLLGEDTTADVAKLAADSTENAYNLYLTGGAKMESAAELKGDITGSGTTEITGYAATQKNIENALKINADSALANTGTISGAVTVAKNGGLVTTADGITGGVANNGQLQLMGGTLASDISGEGETIISDTVTSWKIITKNTVTVEENATFVNNGSVTGNVTVESGATLNNSGIVGVAGTEDTLTNKGTLINTGDIYNKITNTGTLKLEGGRVYSEITTSGDVELGDMSKLEATVSGNGKIVVTGTSVENTADQTLNVVVKESKKLTTTAKLEGNIDIEKEGRLIATEEGALLGDKSKGTTIKVGENATLTALATNINTDVYNSSDNSVHLTGGMLNYNIYEGGTTYIEGNVAFKDDITVTNKVYLENGYSLTNAPNLTNTLYFEGGSETSEVTNVATTGTLAFVLTGENKEKAIVNATNGYNVTGAKVALYQDDKELYTRNDVVKLMTGATGSYAGETLKAKYGDDSLLRYRYKTYQSGGELLAQYIGTGVADEAKSFSEGRLAGAAALTTASDLLAGEGIATAVAAAKASANGTAPFVQIAGSHGKFNTGSHVDLNSLNVVAGIAQKVKDNLTLGGYIEGGNSRYASYNQFDTGEIRADGDINYFGAGVFGKLDFNKTERGNAYVDAAIGAGYTNQDYATESAQLEAARYDASSKYIKAHATVGYQWNLAKGSVDGYAKYLWTRQSGDSPTLSTGEVVNFDAINSHRLRIGARYTQAIKKNFAWYGGLAYEYEFSMNAGANSQGYAIAEPDLKGGSGMAELGLKYAPLTTKGWLFDLGVQGFTGKRDSLGLRLGAWYEF